MLAKYGLVLPTVTSKSIRGKKKQKERVTPLVVCVIATCCHKLPLILIGKYNGPAWFANQTRPLKYAAQKYAWMDIPTLELVQWDFLSWGTQENFSSCSCSSWTILQGSWRHFKGRILWCVVFTPNVIRWKQECNLRVNSAVNKRYKFLLQKT